MNRYFLIIIFILKIFQILSQYTFELIEELVPKYIIFDIIDFNSFKIYKYIPLCKENANQNKSIFVQLETYYNNLDLYLYENFEDIKQNELSRFINPKEHRELINKDNYMADSFSNLICGKDYYFIISLTSQTSYTISKYIEFNIIDASIDKINISPIISNSFAIQKRKPQEILLYSHTEIKYASFYFGNQAEVKILKNNEIIYYKEKEESTNIEPIKFEKNKNYTIYFEGNDNPFISIQFFNEPKIFKVDFNNGPIALYCEKSYYEIDISNYKLNDIILFRMNAAASYRFSYQYKKTFIGNNFIDIGYFDDDNYIPIKKTIEDTSLIVFIEFHILRFSLLNLIKDVEEIKSAFTKKIIGPKYYYIDNFDFNNMNSIGIGANESFLIYEQEKGYKSVSTFRFQNYYITKTKNYFPEIFKNIIIKFNSTNEILFEIKKYNYSIFYKDDEIKYNEEFFQLCQGENSLNELYFYVDIDQSEDKEELFLPVFGTFNSYYIIEEYIKNLSDFDFDKIIQPNFYHTYKKIGYLKIKCEKPLMLKHFILNFDDSFEDLDSGRKYYIKDYYIKHEYPFSLNSNLIKNNLNIKITIYGLQPNQSINLIFNNTSYIYTFSNNSYELIIKYEKYLPDIFHFELDNEIENSLIGEIIVGILPTNIKKMFKQIDFHNCFGNLTLLEKEGVVIKVPNYFSDEFYNFSIIFPGYIDDDFVFTNKFYIDISYDKLEFQTKYLKDDEDSISPIIPLFQVNPYKYIQENLINSTDKFFYIFLVNDDYFEKTIYIKKPMIYSNIKLNQINILPQLNENYANYYYQLKIPEPQNNNYILVQNKKEGFPQKMSFCKNNIQYPYLENFEMYVHYNLPYDKRAKNSAIYLNLYDVEDNPEYINFIETNKHIYPDYYNLLYLNLKVTQLKGKNKLKIKLNSLSYILYPKLVKYYFITNINENYNEIFSIITGKQKLDKKKFQFMKVVNDDGKNEIFEKDIKIDIDLNDNGDLELNEIICIPVNIKTNLIETNYIDSTSFKYKNLTSFQKHKYLIIFLPLGIIIFLIVAIICYFRLRRSTSKDLENKILSEDLKNI